MNSRPEILHERMELSNCDSYYRSKDNRLKATRDYSLILRPDRERADLLKKAYESTKAYLAQGAGNGEWVNNHYCIEDVQKTVSEARNRYESRARSKALIWLTRFCQRVHHYGAVLDVLAQHHPEYVSLVWGTFKLIFGAVVNHEEQIKELAKASTQIADTLPRATITLKLYETDVMFDAVTRLYISITEFLRHAFKWYNQGKLAHTWTAIARPWELGFRDFVDEISRNSRLIEQLANTAFQAELRSTHFEICKTREELREARIQLQSVIQMTYETHSLQSQLQLDLTSSRAAIGRIELNQLLSLPTFAHLPTSGESMNYCRTFRNRRQGRFRLPAPSVTQLRQWSQDKDCSFVFTKSNNSQLSKDFMVSLVETIQASKASAMWAFRFGDYWKRDLGYSDLLKMLVVQALQVNPNAVSTGAFPLTAVSLREAANEKDWLTILNRALYGVPITYAVLDAELVEHTMQGNNYAVTKLLELVPQIVTTTIKVVLADTVIDKNYMRKNWNPLNWTMVTLDDEDKKRNGGPARFGMKPRLKRRRRG